MENKYDALALYWQYLQRRAAMSKEQHSHLYTAAEQLKAQHEAEETTLIVGCIYLSICKEQMHLEAVSNAAC